MQRWPRSDKIWSLAESNRRHIKLRQLPFEKLSDDRKAEVAWIFTKELLLREIQSVLKMENIHYNRQMNTKHIRELLLP
jgi:magnesium chelatase family protein